MKKLLIAIVQHDDASALTRALTSHGYRTTRYASHGGFLRRGNETFLIGVDEEQVEDVLHLIGETCRPRTQPLAAPPTLGPNVPVLPFSAEVRVGGATVFVAPLERLQQL
ncbi:MAG: cyclic-di-AMP receptor [Chloroflexota bacterium]